MPEKYVGWSQQGFSRMPDGRIFQPELVGGYARAGYVITPFCYTLTNLTTRQTEGRCDWKRPETAETVAEGETLAVDPAARLQTDVAGHAL